MDFRDLPTELNENIATFLDDKNLCTFTLICRHTCNAVRGNKSGIWRRRFKEHFDLDPSFSKETIRSVYQERRKWLRKGAKFLAGKTKAEIECLRVIRDLIVESYTGKTEDGDDGEPISKNMLWLAHFVRNHGILHEALLPRNDNKSAEPLLHTIRVMLSHLNLDFGSGGETYGFPDSQLMVYRSSVAQPIFLDPSKQKVDMLYVSHLINFFKYHMTRRHEYTLFDEYTAMGELERPQAWRSQIKAGSSKIGRHWKGTYSYISNEREFFQMRSYSNADDQDHIIADEFNGFQDLELEFPAADEEVLWPRVFEEHLHAFPPAHVSEKARARAQAQSSTANGKKMESTAIEKKIESKHAGAAEWKNIPFRGVGADTESFLATGWLAPLPSQPITKTSPPPTIPSSTSSSHQRPTRTRTLRSTTNPTPNQPNPTRPSCSTISGIPGFQRLTMMKYYLTPAGTYDDGALWAYEGVVLPGGMLIVGRWWSASDERGVEDSFSGPFVLWNVDRSVAVDEVEEGDGDADAEESGL